MMIPGAQAGVSTITYPVSSITLALLIYLVSLHAVLSPLALQISIVLNVPCMGTQSTTPSF